MGFSFTDSTSNTQVMASSNAGGFSLGSATPDTGLQAAIRRVFDGFGLTTGSVPSAGVNRVTGSVVLTSQEITTVTLARNVVGFGSMPGAFILRISGNQMDAAFPERNSGITQTFNYSVF
jgi:hypothetical protein